MKKTSPRQRQSFVARFGAMSGAVEVIAKAAAPRASYEWQYSIDGGKTWVSTELVAVEDDHHGAARRHGRRVPGSRDDQERAGGLGSAHVAAREAGKDAVGVTKAAVLVPGDGRLPSIGVARGREGAVAARADGRIGLEENVDCVRGTDSCFEGRHFSMYRTGRARRRRLW
jgi:hypothetical protein